MQGLTMNVNFKPKNQEDVIYEQLLTLIDEGVTPLIDEDTVGYLLRIIINERKYDWFFERVEDLYARDAEIPLVICDDCINHAKDYAECIMRKQQIEAKVLPYLIAEEGIEIKDKIDQKLVGLLEKELLNRHRSEDAANWIIGNAPSIARNKYIHKIIEYISVCVSSWQRSIAAIYAERILGVFYPLLSEENYQELQRELDLNEMYI